MPADKMPENFVRHALTAPALVLVLNSTVKTEVNKIKRNVF
jgi:hypothetical protein